ncbi:MAG TPA: rhodanese-like domain-containing protein [Candidatus Eisenbacteria bacterium]
MEPNRDPEPGASGTLRGAVLILVAGVALGIAYNSLGLASRPRHGLAWINRPEKIASLEALQAIAEPGTALAATATAASSKAAAAPDSSKGKADTTAAKSAKSAASHAAGRAPATSAAPAGHAAKPAAGSKAGAAHAAKPGRTGTAPATGSAKAGTGAAAPPAAQAPAPAAQAPAPAAQAASPPAPVTPPASPLPSIPDVPGPIKLELATFKRLYDAGAALVIDAREADDYKDGHIGGAISLPYNDAMAEPERVSRLDPGGRPIVVYCSGGDCELSMDLAKLMVQAGKRKVLVYEGGFPEWQSAGYAVVRGANP